MTPRTASASPAIERAVFAAFGAGAGVKRRLWAAIVFPDAEHPERVACGATLYAEAGWSVVRVTRHAPLIDLRPAAYLEQLLRRRPAGYRSRELPAALDPRFREARTLLERIAAAPLDLTVSVSGV